MTDKSKLHKEKIDNGEGNIGFVTDSSNLYSDPDADSSMVGCVRSGEQVLVCLDEDLKDWLYILNSYGVYGYCNREAISILERI